MTPFLTLKILCIIGTLGMLGMPSVLQSQDFIHVPDLEHFVIASGKGIGPGNIVRFEKGEITRINEARKILGKETVKLTAANTNAMVNRECVGVWLSLLQGEFNQRFGKFPDREDLLLYWLKRKEKVKLDEELNLKLSLFRELEKSKSKIPPPLPTNEKLIPTRISRTADIPPLPPINVPKPKDRL